MRAFAYVITVLAVAAASPAVSATPPNGADVDALRRLVAKDQAYRPDARREAERRLARLGSLISQPAAFEMEVARIIALADNGHSVVFPGQWAKRYPRSPVRLGLFADGLYVIEAPAKYRDLPGRPVERINGRDWRDVRRELAAYQGGERAFRDQFVTLFMETPALMAAAGLGPSDRLELAMTEPAGQPAVTIRPEILSIGDGFDAYTGKPAARLAVPLVSGEAPLYLRYPDKPFIREGLPQLDATYIRMDSVVGAELIPFLDETLSELRAKPHRHIILDLRFNMGGDLNNARDFAKALPSLASAQIYAITSGRTFSAAISTLGYLKEAAGDRLTIVGEPVGDRLEFWAEGDIEELPGAGTEVLVATERHNYSTGCQESDCHGSIKRNPIRVKSLQPDIATPFTFAALKAARDPAMEAVAADIERHKGR